MHSLSTDQDPADRTKVRDDFTITKKAPLYPGLKRLGRKGLKGWAVWLVSISKATP